MVALLALLTLAADGRPSPAEASAQCAKTFGEMTHQLCGEGQPPLDPTMVGMIRSQRDLMAKQCKGKESAEALKALDACLKGKKATAAPTPTTAQAAVAVTGGSMDPKAVEQVKKDPEYQRIHARYREAVVKVNQSMKAVSRAKAANDPAKAEAEALRMHDASSAQAEALSALNAYFEVHDINPMQARLAGLW